MYRGNSSRLLPIVLVLIVVALAIAGMVAAGRAIFGGDQTDPAQANIGREALLNVSGDRSVRMTVRGPLVADENFRSYQVTIDASSRVMKTYSGYVENPLEVKQRGNSVKAYEEFVYALDKANLMKGEPLEGDKDDTRGICANGNVYEFEVMKGGSTVKRLWTSTCRGSSGSLKASVEQVRTLFLNQIPESKEALRSIDL